MLYPLYCTERTVQFQERELTTTASDYHAKVDERLVNLPGDIADGLDLDMMAEKFRQQFAATGLQSSAGLLRDSSREITALSDKLAATLAPLGDNYTKIAGGIGTELERLTAANRSMAAYNAQLIREQPGNSWQWQGVLLVIMFLLGGLCGVLFEKGQSTEVLSKMNSQMERLQCLRSCYLAEGSPSTTLNKSLVAIDATWSIDLRHAFRIIEPPK